MPENEEKARLQFRYYWGNIFMISIARPLFGFEEEASVQRVLTSGQLAQGENVAAFERGFAEVCHGSVQTPIKHPEYRHVYHQYTIRISKHRDEFATCLRDQGIGTAVHYLLPIHQQLFYRDQLDNLKFFIGDGYRERPHRGSDQEAKMPVPATLHIGGQY